MNTHGLALTSFLLISACGSSQPSSSSAAPATPAPQAEQSTDIGEGIPWADKNRDQKIAVMKTRVMPAVKEIWKQSPNPEEEVTCETCHGSGAMQGKFDMPSTGIVALDPSNQFAAHADEAEWLQFMGTKLAPTMVEALGVTPYDPATQKGFGCFACHGMVQSE